MYRAKRRDFLEQVTALGAVSTVTGWRPNLARAGAAPERSGGKMSYDPTGKFELKIGDVEFPRTPNGWLCCLATRQSSWLKRGCNSNPGVRLSRTA